MYWIWMVLLRPYAMTLIFFHLTVHHLSWSFVRFCSIRCIRLVKINAPFYFKTNLLITKHKETTKMCYAYKTTTRIQRDKKKNVHIEKTNVCRCKCLNKPKKKRKTIVKEVNFFHRKIAHRFLKLFFFFFKATLNRVNSENFEKDST